MITKRRTPGTTQQHGLSTEHEEGRADSSSVGRVPQVNRRAIHWSAHRKRDAWLLLIALLLGIGAIMTLSFGGAQLVGHGSGTRPAAFPTAATTAAQREAHQFPQPGCSPVRHRPTSTRFQDPISV